MSNFYCHPGKAGGSPNRIAASHLATIRSERLSVRVCSKIYVWYRTVPPSWDLSMCGSDLASNYRGQTN